MRRLTQEQLTGLLFELGLQPGEGVMAHAAVQFLGQPQGGPGIYYAALDGVLALSDNLGTLVVPTFNFGFARGEPFDQLVTPSD
ncbi:MAG: hypothetical protein JW862_07530, partial [Anaerolineales bacterium]|nr:hypothetical protein [Anaerolineales bacterium]